MGNVSVLYDKVYVMAYLVNNIWIMRLTSVLLDLLSKADCLKEL